MLIALLLTFLPMVHIRVQAVEIHIKYNSNVSNDDTNRIETDNSETTVE